MVRLVIDTDPGVDDAHGIMMALAHPGARVEAITTVSGNVTVDLTTANACKILDALGCNVPVYAGSQRALIAQYPRAEYVHGQDGLGDSGLAPSNRKIEPEHAANALVNLANQAPGELTLVAIGPLTNLALALSLDPDLPNKYRRLVVMGGAIHAQGNASPAAEFNTLADPEAAARVFRDWPGFTLISWETTMAYGFNAAQVDELLGMRSRQAEFFRRISGPTLTFINNLLGQKMLFAADFLALAAAIEPEIVTKSEAHFLEVELHGQSSRGQTIVDWRNSLKRPANAELVLEMNADRLWELFKLGLQIKKMHSMLDAGELAARAREYLPDLLAFLKDLVAIHSVNGRDSEKPVAERIAGEAERLGLAAGLFALDPGRPNAVVQWGSGPAGFILVGHMDTVAEGAAQAWSAPPFEARVRDGRLYGRGAADNKAGIACGLYTLAILRDLQRLDPAGVRLMLAGVVDEESGASSRLGMRYLLDQGVLQPARGAIYTYASDIICIGHRGLLRLLLRATGKSVHTGSPAWSRGEAGVNAVTGLAAILLRLEEMELPAPAHPAFPGLGCRMTPGTMIRGGEFESIVPAQAEALVDVRLMPGQPAEGVIRAVEEAILAETARRPGLTVQLEVKNNLPGVAISPQDPLVDSARYWIQAVTGLKWPVAGAGPANEGYMLIQAGIPTLCGFGPTGGGAHAPDEWVDIESLTRTVVMYCGIISDTIMASREKEE